MQLMTPPHNISHGADTQQEDTVSRRVLHAWQPEVCQ
jgi:hypothetical protein